MGEKGLTKEEETVLSYLVLVDEYVKQTNDSDDCDKTTLGEQFNKIFDFMDEQNQDEQRKVFYENLVSLSKKDCIALDDSSYILDIDKSYVYEFTVLEICKKGLDYVHKYMKLNKEKLEITDRKIPKFSIDDLYSVFKKITESGVINLILQFIYLFFLKKW